MAITDYHWTYHQPTYHWTGATGTSDTFSSTWVYEGDAVYADEDNNIKVDKGSPDKAQYAIFYAVEKDPVIFVKNKKELKKELDKLMKRTDVDKKSIRVFRLVGGIKQSKK